MARTRLAMLVNDLIDSAQLETGHIGLAKEQFDLGPLAEACLRSLETSATENGIQLGYP